MKQKMDSVTKAFLVAFVVALSYLVITLILSPLSGRGMMEMMNFSQNAIPNLAALVIAVGIGLLVSINVINKPDGKIKNDKTYALSIVKKKLSDDEKKMMKEIEIAGSITQDSLRVRLNWSKAKVSTIMTRLDKMGLIQRERQGKTYRVFLSKDLR